MTYFQKRITLLDIFRGLGIAVIVIVHRIHYQWAGMNNDQILGQYMRSSLAPLIFITIAFFTMAGIFYVISGTVNSFTIYKRISSGKNTANQVALGGIISGLWLLFLNYIQRIFLMNGFLIGQNGEEPEYPIGLLIGFIQNPKLITFRYSQITEPGTLAVIGLILITVSLVLYFLIRKKGFNKPNRIFNTLTILAFIFLFASPFIKFLLLPVYSSAYNSCNYFVAFLLGFFCHEFSIFPYLGYGFCGAIFGISIAKKESFQLIKKRICNLLKALLFFGLLALEIGTRETGLGERLMGAGISYIELAIFLYLGLLGLKFWDYANESKITKRQNQLKGLKRFGTLALTIYLFEPLVAEILKKIVDKIFGSFWTNNLLLVIGFGFICFLFWMFVVKIWEGISYIGSVEWCAKNILYKLSKKDISVLPSINNIFFDFKLNKFL